MVYALSKWQPDPGKPSHSLQVALAGLGMLGMAGAGSAEG